MGGNVQPPESGATTTDEYELLVDTLHISVSKHMVNEDITLVWANRYYYDFIGYTQEEYETLFHCSPFEYFAGNPEDVDIVVRHLQQALAEGRDGFECLARLHVKGGELKWVRFTVTFLDEYVDGCQLAYTVMTDVSDLVEAQQQVERQKLELEEANVRLAETNAQLERLAFVDEITEGFNQAQFDLVAAGVLANVAPGTHALVSLDLKKFKLLNEINGTESGDQVLRYIYRRLRSHLNEGECVARITADAFNLLLRIEGIGSLYARIDAMVQDINSFNEGSSRPYYLSFTVGVYIIDDPSLPMTIVRDRANVARSAGKDSADARHFTFVLYSDVDRQNLLSEQDMENRMRGALDRGEFVAYLQPKQTLSDGRIGGAEALVRWIDPVRGMIPPDEFVPFFERNGFIVDVDLCVFDQVCALLASWIGQGRQPVPISVNMSRVHLREADFLKPYEQIRGRYDVPAELIEFELTETLIFGDSETFIGVIDRMHACGYRCSLDDFGSGYSSLNVLKDVCIDTMKLDRAFFSAGERTSQREWNVVESVVELAKKLDLKTVAEGVEEPSQVDRLRAMHCDMLQGYVFSRPVPVREFEHMLFGE